MSFAALILCLVPGAGDGDAWKQAAALAWKGDEETAFLRLLALPGGEWPASHLARSQPGRFLPLLSRACDIPLPRRLLVEGDLRLFLGDQSGALACYRRAV